VDSTWMGALISKDHLEKVKSYIQLAVKDGNRLLCGEEALDLPVANQKVFNLSFNDHVIMIN